MQIEGVWLPGMSKSVTHLLLPDVTIHTGRATISETASIHLLPKIYEKASDKKLIRKITILC